MATEDDKKELEHVDEGASEEQPKQKTVNVEKYNRLLERFSELEGKYKETTTKLEELSKASVDADDLKKQLEELKTSSQKDLEEAKARFAASEKDHAIEAALLKAGCKDVVATRAHIAPDAVTLSDGKLSGLDVEALKKDYGYLFGIAAPAGSAGGTNPDGAAQKSTIDKLADVFKTEKKEG